MADYLDRVLAACLAALREADKPLRCEDLQRATGGRFFASEVQDAMAKGERERLVERVPALIGSDAFMVRHG